MCLVQLPANCGTVENHLVAPVDTKKTAEMPRSLVVAHQTGPFSVSWCDLEGVEGS